MIESGADIYHINSKGQSAILFGTLYWANSRRHAEDSAKVVEYFKDKPYPKDERNALLVAVGRKDISNVRKYLASVDDINFDIGFGSTLEVSTDLKFTDYIPLLLEREAIISERALFSSARTPNIFIEFAKRLGGIDQGTAYEGKTITEIAIRVGSYDAVKEYLLGDVRLSDEMCYELVDQYIDRHTHLREEGKYGSRIYKATTNPRGGKFEKFEKLYKSGQCDKEKLAGEAFYHTVDNLDVEYTNKLLKLGIKADTPSRQRGTPLNQVVKDGCNGHNENNLHIDIIKSLVRAGADPKQSDSEHSFQIGKLCRDVESNIPRALGIE